MNIRTFAAAAGIAGTLATGTMLLTCGTASADPFNEFEGRVCRVMDEIPGTAGIDAVVREGYRVGPRVGMDTDRITEYVIEAVTEECPQHTKTLNAWLDS